MYPKNIREKVIQLRKGGGTYGEIQKALGLAIPKSTLSDWCSGILLSQFQKMRLEINSKKQSEKGLAVALEVNKIKRKKYLASIDKRIYHLAKTIKNKDVAKIIAATLYLGEGGKKRKGTLSLGNSDPGIMGLFLQLLRYAYKIDESRFRCTLQCRADQNIKKLEVFWSGITKIPMKQFYGAQIDPRTLGKKSKKPEYKGVCRVDYFSADLFIELMKIGELLCNTGL